MTVLIDTHALVWWQAGGRRLSKRAASAIDGAVAILVSPLTAWEVVTLQRLGRLVLDREPIVWMRDVMRGERMTLAPLSAEAAAWAGTLPATFPGDPIDRLLYATARDLRVPFLSKDKRLHSFARTAGDVDLRW